MITLELTDDDAKFLREQLKSRAQQVENELIHTDKRAMQADIARDLERLERLNERLLRAVTMVESQIAV